MKIIRIFLTIGLLWGYCCTGMESSTTSSSVSSTTSTARVNTYVQKITKEFDDAEKKTEKLLMDVRERQGASRAGMNNQLQELAIYRDALKVLLEGSSNKENDRLVFLSLFARIVNVMYPNFIKPDDRVLFYVVPLEEVSELAIRLMKFFERIEPFFKSGTGSRKQLAERITFRVDLLDAVRNSFTRKIIEFIGRMAHLDASGVRVFTKDNRDELIFYFDDYNPLYLGMLGMPCPVKGIKEASEMQRRRMYFACSKKLLRAELFTSSDVQHLITVIEYYLDHGGDDEGRAMKERFKDSARAVAHFFTGAGTNEIRSTISNRATCREGFVNEFFGLIAGEVDSPVNPSQDLIVRLGGITWELEVVRALIEKKLTKSVGLIDGYATYMGLDLVPPLSQEIDIVVGHGFIECKVRMGSTGKADDRMRNEFNTVALVLKKLCESGAFEDTDNNLFVLFSDNNAVTKAIAYGLKKWWIQKENPLSAVKVFCLYGIAEFEYLAQKEADLFKSSELYFYDRANMVGGMHVEKQFDARIRLLDVDFKARQALKLLEQATDAIKAAVDFSKAAESQINQALKENSTELAQSAQDLMNTSLQRIDKAVADAIGAHAIVEQENIKEIKSQSAQIVVKAQKTKAKLEAQSRVLADRANKIISAQHVGILQSIKSYLFALNEIIADVSWFVFDRVV